MEGKDMLAEREVIKRAKIAYGQALQTAGGFAIVRVLLLQRTKFTRICAHCRKG
jgi:hypothetical protein